MTESVRPSRRMCVSVRAGATAAVLALAVTGCGSGAGNADPDTGAPVSTQSATADAPPTSPGSAGSTDTSNASPQPTSTAFVPASSEGPAQNVPVPEMPEAAREQTQEGLEAALEYWWEANFYLKSTGDSEPLRSVSANSCKLCQSQIERWPQVYHDGAWIATKPAEVTIELSSVEENGLAGTTLFVISEAPGDLYLRGGKRVDEASGNGSLDQTWSASTVFSQSVGHWQIEDIRTQD